MSAVRFDPPPQRRGDTVYINLDDVLDRNGAAVTLDNYSLRAVAKPITSVTTDDSDALATITSGSGITVTGNDAELAFPPSLSSAFTASAVVKYDLQATNSSNANEVRTLLYGEISFDLDTTRTSP
jgi:hypothetical protein